MKLAPLQQAAVETAIENIIAIQRGIGSGGTFEIKDFEYDQISPKLSTAKYWLELLIKDSEKEV